MIGLDANCLQSWKGGDHIAILMPAAAYAASTAVLAREGPQRTSVQCEEYEASWNVAQQAPSIYLGALYAPMLNPLSSESEHEFEMPIESTFDSFNHSHLPFMSFVANS
eukprot:365709-Chlamydomonas_euryale.AAC.5